MSIPYREWESGVQLTLWRTTTQNKRQHSIGRIELKSTTTSPRRPSDWLAGSRTLFFFRYSPRWPVFSASFLQNRTATSPIAYIQRKMRAALSLSRSARARRTGLAAICSSDGTCVNGGLQSPVICLEGSESPPIAGGCVSGENADA